MVLHHLGETTLSDIQQVEKECVAAGAKTVVVAGDISNPKTAQDVSISANI
jgi:L-rhamnose 1-dehydrogenase